MSGWGTIYIDTATLVLSTFSRWFIRVKCMDARDCVALRSLLALK